MSKKTSKNGASTWCGRGRGFVTVVAAIAAVPLMKTAFAEAQATTTVSSSGDMDNTGSARLNVTRTENRRLYHIDVTEKGEPCLDNPILERIIDPTTYEYGCRDIQHMLTGEKSLIGSGSVRDVWLVEYKGRTVVVKTLRHMESRRSKDMHLREVLTMDAIGVNFVFQMFLRIPEVSSPSCATNDNSNPKRLPVLVPTQLRGQRNIVGMLGLCETTVVTEYFPTKLLHFVFRHGKQVPYGQLVSMSLDALKGLQALHEVAGCLHIDLKPMQLLVDEDGRVKLNDFNSVRVLSIDPNGGEFCPAPSSKRRRVEPWPSPENYAGKALTDKADIYSMGMILYSLLAGRKPFEDQKSLELAISEGRRPVMDSSWHRDFVEVIEEMWLEDPKLRPSARQVVARLEEIQSNLERGHSSLVSHRLFTA